MSATSVPCGRTTDGAAPCGLPCRSWRQCPIPGCGFNVARCDGHGGDKRAMGMMLDHVAEHVTAAPPATMRGFEVVRMSDGSGWNILDDGTGIAFTKSKVQADRIAAALAGHSDGERAACGCDINPWCPSHGVAR